jgi:hypothetical protein
MRDARETDDRLAIQDLINRYSDAVTRADWDQHVAVFVRDAVLEVGSPFDFKAEGAEDIRRQTSEGSARLDCLIQTVHSSVISLTGADHASATSTIHEMGLAVAPVQGAGEEEETVNFDHYGVYYDEIVRIDGEWKFARRYCQPIYVAFDTLTGQGFAPRASLADRRR